MECFKLDIPLATSSNTKLSKSLELNERAGPLIEKKNEWIEIVENLKSSNEIKDREIKFLEEKLNNLILPVKNENIELNNITSDSFKSLQGEDKYESKPSVVMVEPATHRGNCSGSYQFTTEGLTRIQLHKNSLRIWINFGAKLFLFGLPVMQVILFCLAVGQDPTGLHLAIVNHEINWETNNCPINKHCTFTNLSCRYLNALPDKKIVQNRYQDVDSAIKAVETGDAWGVLYFTENFTDALVARIALGHTADEETLDQSEIRVWLDMSNQQIGLMLNHDLLISYRNFAQELLKSCEYNPKLADVPIQFKEPIYGSNNLNITNFLAPFVILIIVFFLAVTLTSPVHIIGKKKGLVDNGWVIGVTPVKISFSHIITQFGIMLAQTASVLIFMIAVFKVECKGNLMLVILLTILQGVCGLCFGLVISVICELKKNAIQLALGSFYATLLLSGVVWPIEGMPIILQYISLCLPLTMATTSLRNILTRGWNFLEHKVYMGFISTIIWITVLLFVSIVTLNFKRNKVHR